MSICWLCDSLWRRYGYKAVENEQSIPEDEALDLKLRLPDGRQVVRRLRRTLLVKELYDFGFVSMGQGFNSAFTLRQVGGGPLLEDLELTLEQAGLCSGDSLELRLL